MTGWDQDSATLRLSLLIVLEAFIGNPLRNVGWIEVGKTSQGDQQTGDGVKDTIDDPVTRRGIEIRKREGKIFQRHAAKLRRRNIEEESRAPSEAIGRA